MIKPSAFAPVADALVAHAQQTQNLELAAWAVGVRKGSRWSSTSARPPTRQRHLTPV